MRKSIFIFTLVLLLGEIHLNAQTYHPLPDDKIRVFEVEYYNQSWESFAIQVNERDTIDGNEVIFLNNQVLNDYAGIYPCLLDDSGSWFAKFLQISPTTGNMRIYNESNFYIVAPLNADPGEQFIATFLPSGHFVLVTVVDESEKMVLGKQEMVKEFLFEVLRQGDEEPNPDHYLHEKRMKIGAESGLIESFTFNVPESDNPLRGVLRLKQIVSEIGEVRPAVFDIFPFEAGDSLHVLETMETPAKNTRNEIRYEILERNFDAGSGMLSFSVQKEFDNYTNYMGEVYMNSGILTADWIIYPDQYLDVKLPNSYTGLLPGEQELRDNNDELELKYYHLRSGENSPYNRREIHFFHEWMTTENVPFCIGYSAPLSLPSYYSKYFIEGLGGPYFYLNELERRPVFVSTKNERWGEPLDFTVSVDELPAEKTTIRVYPNPINRGGELIIDLGESRAEKIKLIDLSGKVVYSEKGGQQSRLTLNNSVFPGGTYLLKVVTTKGLPAYQLLVVH